MSGRGSEFGGRGTARDAAALEMLRRLRGLRVMPSRDLSIGGEVQRTLREARSRLQATGDLSDGWDGLAPAHLAQRVRPQGLARGVLTLRADDAPSKYQFEQWLRAGGLATLRGASGKVRSVKVVVGG